MENLNKNINFRHKKNLIEVYSPDFVVSPTLNKLEEKKSHTEKEVIEKLLANTTPYLRFDINKLAIVSIAGLIALAGLFMNNVAIIIGAMLLSPLLGPIYAFAINSAVGKTKDVIKSFVNLLVMIGSVIIFSSVFTLILFIINDPILTEEILTRIEPNYIYVFISFALGFASMLALTKGISESIAGVAIATALVPPAAVSGIFLVVSPMKSIGPLIIVFQNIFGLMVGSLFGAILLDVGPREYYKKSLSNKIITRVFVILFLLVIALIILTL